MASSIAFNEDSKNCNVIDLDPDLIDDAYIVRGKLILKTKSGRTITLPAETKYLNLYWEVKLRNRRRAFGL